MMYARWKDEIPGENVWIKGVMVGVITTMSAMIVSGMVTPRSFVRPLVAMIGSLSLYLVLVLGLSKHTYGKEKT